MAVREHRRPHPEPVAKVGSKLRLLETTTEHLRLVHLNSVLYVSGDLLIMCFGYQWTKVGSWAHQISSSDELHLFHKAPFESTLHAFRNEHSCPISTNLTCGKEVCHHC